MRLPLSISALCLVFLVSCAPTPSNQVQGALSPNQAYHLWVPIEPSASETGSRVWKVTITDPDDKILYKDEQSTMPGNLRVYWGWDDQNRVWVYNSDDGAVWRWELQDGEWKRIPSQKSDGIPSYILPAYARKP